jgi:hypothetical protein
MDIDVQREGFAFTVRIEDTNQNLVLVSAWNRSLLLPDNPQVTANWAFYMQIANCNAASGRMTWNEEGQCGFRTAIISSGVVPETTLSRVVEELLNQLLQVWPGLCEVSKGVSPDVAFVKFIDRIHPVSYTPARRGSAGLRFLEQYVTAASLPSTAVEGGVRVDRGDFRIEMTADESGRFAFKVLCRAYQVPHDANFSGTFYLAIANANRSLGTMYIDTNSQSPVSRLEIFVEPSALPSQSVIHYGFLGLVNELGCHVQGLREVSRGAGIMDAYANAMQQFASRQDSMANRA